MNDFKTAGPLFDDTVHTQGGMPHIIQYLWGKYRQSVAAIIERLTAEGKKTKPLDQILSETSAIRFVSFCTRFLKEHRVVENFPLDDNHGIRLSNTDMVAIGPGVEIRGTMQESGSVDVTSGRSQTGLNGVIIDESIRII